MKSINILTHVKFDAKKKSPQEAVLDVIVFNRKYAWEAKYSAKLNDFTRNTNISEFKIDNISKWKDMESSLTNINKFSMNPINIANSESGMMERAIVSNSESVLAGTIFDVEQGVFRHNVEYILNSFDEIESHKTSIESLVEFFKLIEYFINIGLSAQALFHGNANITEGKIYQTIGIMEDYTLYSLLKLRLMEFFTDKEFKKELGIPADIISENKDLLPDKTFVCKIPTSLGYNEKLSTLKKEFEGEEPQLILSESVKTYVCDHQSLSRSALFWIRDTVGIFGHNTTELIRAVQSLLLHDYAVLEPNKDEKPIGLRSIVKNSRHVKEYNINPNNYEFVYDMSYLVYTKFKKLGIGLSDKNAESRDNEKIQDTTNIFPVNLATKEGRENFIDEVFDYEPSHSKTKKEKDIELIEGMLVEDIKEKTGIDNEKDVIELTKSVVKEINEERLKGSKTLRNKVQSQGVFSPNGKEKYILERFEYKIRGGITLTIDLNELMELPNKEVIIEIDSSVEKNGNTNHILSSPETHGNIKCRNPKEAHICEKLLDFPWNYRGDEYDYIPEFFVVIRELDDENDDRDQYQKKIDSKRAKFLKSIKFNHMISKVGENNEEE